MIKTSNLKWSLLIIFIFFLSDSLIAQTNYYEFGERSIKTSNTGMFILGGWALANISTGAYGWSKYSGQTKYFHQMNLLWNTVNLGIAGIALYKGLHFDASLSSAEEIIAKHNNTIKLLLINSTLDIGYIGTGFLLKHLALNSEKRTDLLKGYGNSLILQGSFLLIFDLCLYGILKSMNAEFTDGINFSLANDMKGLHLVFNF